MKFKESGGFKSFGEQYSTCLFRGHTDMIRNALAGFDHPVSHCILTEGRQFEYLFAYGGLI